MSSLVRWPVRVAVPRHKLAPQILSPAVSAGGVDATVTPAVVAVTVAAPALGVNVAAGPAVLPAVVAGPAAHPNVTAGPATAAAVAALPASTRTVVAAPAVVPAVATVPTPDQVGVATSVRVFDGTADNITCAIGSLADLRDGNLTIAAIVKKNASKDQGLVEFHDGSGIRCALILASDNSIGLQDNAAGATVALTATTNWNVVVVTRSGSTIEGHRYDYGTGVWTHNVTATVAAVGDTLTQVRLGGPGFGDFNGRMAVAGAQATAFSDVQLEALATGLQEWVDLFTGGAVWRLDQTSVSAVPDIVGTADQTAASGTSAVQDSPAGFDWTLTGGGDATVTPATITAAVTVPSSARNVTAGPAAVAVTVAAATPTALAVTAVNPAATAAVVTVPNSTRSIAAGPAVVPVVVAAPPASASGGGAAAVLYGSQLGVPTAQLGDFQLGTTPAVSGNVTATPATITAVVAVGAAQPVAPSTIIPAVVAAAVAVPAAARNVGAGPAVLTATAALTRPDLTISTSPAALVAVGSLTRPNVNVAASPLVVPAVAAVPQVTPVTAGNATVAPAAALVVVAIPQTTPLSSSAVTPAAISAAVTIPGVGTSVGASPAALAALTALPRPSVHVAAGPAGRPGGGGGPAHRRSSPVGTSP